MTLRSLCQILRKVRTPLVLIYVCATCLEFVASFFAKVIFGIMTSRLAWTFRFFSGKLWRALSKFRYVSICLPSKPVWVRLLSTRKTSSMDREYSMGFFSSHAASPVLDLLIVSWRSSWELVCATCMTVYVWKHNHLYSLLVSPQSNIYCGSRLFTIQGRSAFSRKHRYFVRYV